jgi:C4-dicarboxylate-specific signal transduction histidine kinase
VVTLHTEVATLTKQLEREQNQLKKIIKELKQTRNALISQEKIATLGEMTAGLAHEINNPASALVRSVDYLSFNLPLLAERASALPDTGLVRYYFEAGMKREFTNTAVHRERMKELSGKFPFLSRPDLRGLAEMDQELFEKILPYIHPAKNKELFQLLLEAYHSGVFLNNIRLSTSRIEYLVKSLKSYSRKAGSSPELADIREGIRETLQILGSRLKDVKVDIHMPEPAMVNCFVGELNQVWTNIIINACDAMDNKGKLFICCTTHEEQIVEVSIADSGSGVPDKLKKRIFDPTFTTKTAGGDFGLGIGLAITKNIIEKHHGTIEVLDHQGGGAEFLIKLPLATVQ